MYLLDSDVLMAAKNFHYSFDLVPQFWRWIEMAHQAGRVFTVQRVAEEVYAGGDELSDWMRRQPASFRIAPDATDADSLTQVAEWAGSQEQFRQSAVATFLGAGDYFLVAQALTRGYTVVTGETIADPSARVRIKIPNVCAAFNVCCVTLFKMLRAEGARFG